MHAAQANVVTRLKGVRGRHRRGRNADVHGAKGEQRMIDAVLGEEHHRPSGRRASLEQGRPDAREQRRERRHR